MYAWQKAYWDATVSHRVPGLLILAIVVAHGLCCNQQVIPALDVDGIPSNLTVQRPPIHTPAIDLLRAYQQRQQGKTFPPSEERPPEEESRAPDGAKQKSLDPISLIYDAVMSDQREAQYTNRGEEDVCMTQAMHGALLSHCPVHPGVPDVWGVKNIAIMYLVCILGFLMMWIPSTHNLFQCSGEGVWTIATCFLLCMGGSFSVCAPLYYFLPLAKTVTVAVMHMCAQHLYAMAYVAYMSHNSPFYMANLVGNCYMGVIGFALLALTQLSRVPQFSDYSTAEFYMAHAWGLILTEAVRFLVYAPMVTVCGI